MKTKQIITKQITLCAGLLVACLLGPVARVHATALTWDANTGTTGAQDGSGTWDSGTPWWNGSADQAWNSSNPDTATIGAGSGAAGTITIGSAVTSGNITFAAPGSGNYVISGGTLTLSGTPTITMNSAATINSILAGTGFATAGTSSLTLGGVNTFIGNLAINSLMDLTVTSDSNLGNTNNNVVYSVGSGGGAYLTLGSGFSSATNRTVSISNNRTLYVTCSGGIATWNGNMNCGNSSCQLRLTGGSGTLDLGTYAVYNGAGSTLYSDTGSVTVDGTIGPSTSTVGTLQIGRASSGTSTWIARNSAMIRTTSGVSLCNNSSATSLTCSLTVQDTATVVAPTLTLGANGGTGTLNLNGGTNLVGTVAKGTGSGVVNFNGGLLKASAASTTFLTGLTSANVQSGGAIIDDGGFAITISQILLNGAPSGGLTKQGAGTLTLSGANTYTNGTTITAGTLNINGVNALGGSGTYGGLTLNGGTLQYSNTLTSGSDLSPGKSITVSAGGGTIDVNGNSVTYVNAIGNSGSGTLTVISTAANGMLALQGANTYTGGTTVSSGTLNVINSSGSATGTGGVTVNGGTLTGTGSISGAVTNLSGTLSPKGTNGILTLGSLVLNGGNNLFNFDAGFHTNGIITLTGALTLTAGNIQLNITDGTLANGTYRLINCSGTPGGAAGSLSVSGFAQGGQVASLSAVSGGLNLVISTYVPQNLVWVGDGSANLWNVDLASNWDDTTTSANPWVYNNTDNTTFDNTSANTTVNLVGALTPGSVTVNGTQSYTLTNTGSIDGATALTNNSSGTLTILTANTYTGGTVINSGAVQLGNGTISGALGTGGVTNNAALIMDSPARVATGPINGTGNVTIDVGTLAIGGNSTINTLTLGSSGQFGILDLTNNSLTVSSLVIGSGATTCYIGNGGTVAASTIYYNGGSSTFGGVIEDVLGGGTETVALNVNSSGILTLTSNNTYTGGTVINSGTVTLTGSGSLGSGQVTLNGGTLYEDSDLINNTISNAPSATSFLSYYNNTGGGYGPTLNLVGGGTLSLTLTGSGVFSPGGSVSTFAGTINLSGSIRASTVSGATTYGSANAIWNLGTTGGFFNKYGNQKIYLGALTGSAGSVLTGGNTGNAEAATIYVVGNLNTTNTFGGNITDGSADLTGLTKVGTGVLILNGATYSYSDPTIVSNGTLELDSTLGDYTATTNYAGATLAGSGTFTGPVDMEPGSTLAPGAYGPGNYGTLNLSDDGTIPGSGLSENGCTNLFDISASSSDQVNVTGGGLSLAGANVVVLNISGTLSDGNYTLINYNGGSLISGSVLANMTVTPSQVGNQFFTLVDTGSSIQLKVLTLGSSSLTWLPVPPGGDNLWNSTSVNWTNNGVDYEPFTNGDRVTFNNSGAANSPVDLAVAVAPSGVLVTNSLPYAFKSTSGLGKITGSVTNGLTKSGTGTLTILTTNDFTGPVTISAGIVQVGDGNTPNTGLSAGVVTNNALLIFDQTNNNYTVVTNLTGTGSLVQEGSNTVTLAGNTTYSGTTLVNTGTLQFGNGGPTAFPTNAISLANNGTVNFDLAGAYAVTNGITGNGWVVFSGPGTNNYGGVNTYTNNTSISGGVVKLTGTAVLPTGGGITGWTVLDGAGTAGTLDLNGNSQTLNGLSGLTGTVLGKIVNNGGTGISTLTISNWGNPTYAGQILDTNVVGSSGKIALVIAGAGTQTLTGANTYSGGTTIYGTLAISQAASIGTNMITLIGGTLTNTADLNLYNVANLTVPAATNGTIDMPGLMKLPNLYGSGTLALNVYGTAAGSGSGSYGDAFGACSNFSGILNITGEVTGAKMVFNYNNTSGGSSDGQLTNATVNLYNGVSLVGLTYSTGSGAQIGALNVDATSFLAGGYVPGGATMTYTIGELNTTSDIEGVITNGANSSTTITKVGSGTLILNNSGNTYTGNTTVNAGTLQVNGQITASPITVNTGGILSGIGTIASVVTNNTGAVLYPGTNGIGQLTLSSNLVLTATSTNLFMVTTAGGASNSVAVTGGAFAPNSSVIQIKTADNANLGAGTNVLFNYTGSTISGTFNTTPVFVTTQTGLATNAFLIDTGSKIELAVSNSAGGPVVSTDASLSYLALSPLGALSPNFNPGTTNYTATNANATTSVTVTVTNTSTYATNQVFLNGVAQGLPTVFALSVPVSLGVGNTNVIQVHVTAQDGSTVSNYFVNVTRLPSPVGYLLTLVVSNNLNAGVGLTPGFTTNVPSVLYAATNTLPANQVKVTVTDVDPTATNTLYLNGASQGPLSSGITSSLLSLNAGSNNVTVQVVSQDLSATNTYKVNVVNQPSLTAPHLTNSVSGTTLALSWPADHLGYRLLEQTNNLNKGVSGNTNDWMTLPNTTSMTGTNLTIIKTGVTNEYFRLVYP